MSVDLLNVQPGQELPGITVSVDRDRLVAYANASGDQNPIHQDEAFAKSVGLPNVIAHGMWTMGAAIEVVTGWTGDPTSIVSYSTRFTSPVEVPADGGAEIVVGGVVKKVDEATGRVTIELSVTSGGTKVLGRALAIVRTAPAQP